MGDDHHGGRPGMPGPDGLGGPDPPGLSLPDGLAGREAEVGGMGLQLAPCLQAVQLAVGAALPLPVVHLGEVVDRVHLHPVALGDRCGRLLAPLEWRRVDGLHGEVGEALRHVLGLPDAFFGQVHTGEAARQACPRHGRDAVTDEQKEHGHTVPAIG